LVRAPGVGFWARAVLVAVALPLAGLFFFAGLAATSALATGTGSVGCSFGLGQRRALWRVVGLDTDGRETGAGDPKRRRVVAAPAAAAIDQALRLEAAEHLVDRAAPDLERLGQRQHGTVVALRGRAQDHGLGIAELGHGTISVGREHHRPPTALSPAGRTRSGHGLETARSLRSGLALLGRNIVLPFKNSAW
jgi:hypothetical protein